MKEFELDGFELIFLKDKIIKKLGFKLKNKNTNPVYELLFNLKNLNRIGILYANWDHLEFTHEYEEYLEIASINKEYNNLYKFITNLSEKKINKIIGVNIISEKNHKNYIKLIYNEIRDLLILDYLEVIDCVKFKFGFDCIDDLIENELNIMDNSDFRIIAPIILSNEDWQQLVISELKKKDSIKEMNMLLKALKKSLDSLHYEFIYQSGNAPFFFNVNNRFYFLEHLKENNLLYIYPISIIVSYKETFLDTFNSKKIEGLYNLSIKSRYHRVKLLKTKIEKELRNNLLEIHSQKHYSKIIKGLFFVLEKQNPNYEKNELKKITENIITNIFYVKESNSESLKINSSLKMNNKLFIEFIYFLSSRKGYIISNENKIPLIISRNLNYNGKGYSYKNLYRIFNEIKKDNCFDFSGLTSVRALNNYMK